MPRYHFHAEDGVCYPDPDGLELPDIEAAKKSAVQYLTERLKGNSDELWDTGSWRVIVTDEHNLTLFIIDVCTTLSAAFPPRAAPPGVSRKLTDVKSHAKTARAPA
jgi:hypothetical protein